MKRLTKPQQVRLIKLVIDTHGGDLNKRVFMDVVFTLFEDISGMEVNLPLFDATLSQRIMRLS